MTRCPDENVIARFVRGGLAPAEAHGVELHVDRCSACATLISALAQMGASGGAIGGGSALGGGGAPGGGGAAPLAGGLVTHPVTGMGSVAGEAAFAATAPAQGGMGPATGGAAAPAFGRYVVERPLGAGAMGIVYAAHDPVLGRRVALKVLRREAAVSAAAAAELDARLMREARAMAALAHPNVVPVHDAGVVGDQVYLAMELVEGQTLDRWLAARGGPGARGGGRAAWREVLAVFRDAGVGLSAAHEAGILHRDFKPANVLIGADGRARVTDFGLARVEAAGPGAGGGHGATGYFAGAGGATGHFAATEAGGAGVAHMMYPNPAATTAGALVGTPAYMAPEQMWSRPVDARADQFSFCVALYEALFGAQPFGGTTLAERRYCLAHQGPAWPADLRGAPRAVAAAVMRGLSPAPEGRFPSMRALVEALDEAGSRAGEVHVLINVVCQGIAGAVHAALMAAFIASNPLGKPLQSATPGPSGAAVESSLSNTLIGAAAGASFLGLLLFFVMTPIGVVWAPLNAIGLWRRWSWARASTMVYGGMCVLSCLGLPYGVYALWSLRRPAVREAFSRREAGRWR